MVSDGIGSKGTMLWETTFCEEVCDRSGLESIYPSRNTGPGVGIGGKVNGFTPEAVANAKCPQHARDIGVKAPKSPIPYPKLADLVLGKAKCAERHMEA